MKRKNMISMVTSLALVGVVAVGGTLALLTSQSDKVTNTFTIGNGYPPDALTLDEAPVTRVTSGTDNFGGYNETDGTRVSENKYLNLVADTTLDKDPTFHLKAESPDSWIIAKVEGVDDLKDAGVSITAGAVPEGYCWKKLDLGNPSNPTAITDYSQLEDGYYVTNTVIAGGVDTSALFEELTVGAPDELDREAIGSAEENGRKIKVEGVAVEALNKTWAGDYEAVLAQVADFIA